MIARLLMVTAIAVALYLLLWPVPVAPVAWNAPENPGYQGVFAPNTALAGVEQLDMAATQGPEALALGPNGLLYTSSHEGWIVRYDPVADSSERWVNTGGRPLGLAFDAAGKLLVADAYLGLLAISPEGELTILSDRLNGAPILYADDVDVAPDGRVYFSDASSKFGARAWGGTYEASLLDLMEHGGHGRLLVYDPADGSTDVVLGGLQFANGVAVSADGSFVLVVETASYRITRLWLEGARAGQHEVLIDNLPGFPDNIVRGADGLFWVGLVSPRSAALDRLADKPFLRKVVQRLPAALRPAAAHYGHVFQIDDDGNVLVSLQNPAGTYHTNTGALEHDGWLYISSLHETSLARLRWVRWGSGLAL